MKRPVTVVKTVGRSSLVQYKTYGLDKRVMIPTSEVSSEGYVDDDILDAGIQMSVNWSEYLKITLTGPLFREELYKHGIWTVEDLKNHFAEATKVAVRIITKDVVRMLQEVIGNV